MLLRRIVLVFLVLIFLVTSVSCAMFGSTTEKYLKALENTENAQTMESKTENKIEFDYSKASSEIKKYFEDNRIKKIVFNADEKIDKKNMKGKSSYFLGMGEALVNLSVLVNGDDIYINIPFAEGGSSLNLSPSRDEGSYEASSTGTGEKYIKLNPKQLGWLSNQESKPNKEYEKLYDELLKIWETSIREEILQSEGSTVESTPDGEIKVTRLSLEITDEKAKNIIGKLAELASKSQVIKEMSIEIGKKFSNGEKSDDEIEKVVKEFFDKLPENFESYKDKFVLEKLKLTAKIDKDSYIIDEALEGQLLIKNDGELRMNFDINTSRWNIDRDIDVAIPIIAQDEIIDIKDFEDQFSRFAKDFKIRKEKE